MPPSQNKGLARHSEHTAALSIEEIARYPLPGTAIPNKITFSPDDALLTYLYSFDRSLTTQLYAYDLEAGKEYLLAQPPGESDTEKNIPREVALRRERLRERTLGITHYSWSHETSQLLIPLQGSVYVKDSPKAPLRLLIDGHEAPVIDPQTSPDGQSVAFVQDREIYVVPFAGGTPRRLTHGARESNKTHGLAEYIAQEEMDRRRGFWWSPDSCWIAFTEVDESHIPIYPIFHQGQDPLDENALEEHRYPFAGAANARVRLAIIPADGGKPVWMDLGEDEDIYLARVKWLPSGRLTAQIENRAQTELDLVRFNPQTGARSLLLRESNDLWINLNQMFYPLKGPRADGGGFIWASERTGFRHLYLYDSQGIFLRPLTTGNWIVDSLAAVDEINEVVYFTASRNGPLESHLYAASFDGGAPRRITPEAGTHTVVVDHKHQRFVDTYESIDTPPATTVRSLKDGSILSSIHAETDPRVEKLGICPPELITLENREGVVLHGAIFRPPDHFGSGPHPTIVSVYGGPHVQRVTNSWRISVDMRAQYLSNQGFLVFVLDNRGSARRGQEFEGYLRHLTGHAEVNDQVDGVRWLISKGLTDPQRVGIYGWSYGGYMALMCLARAPETFQAAVAGAPVTHWNGYDTHYTERYMGMPQENTAGYLESSVIHHVDHIRGHLMLVHGLIDENVHFRHTARLINALISARIPYELLLFPDERHMPRKLADRVFMEAQIRDFFLKHFRNNSDD